MNIEQLAIEHGSTCYTGQEYHFERWQLEDFAKAYAQQSSEPVDCRRCPNNKNVVCACCEGSGLTKYSDGEFAPCPQKCEVPKESCVFNVRLLDAIRDDSFAIGFQTLSQYRTALLKIANRE